MPLKHWDDPALTVAGTDEAGRGCLAGPVTAAAVILPTDYFHPLLNDSKQLSERQRETVRQDIERRAISWAITHIWPERIDQINILWAAVEAMQQSVAQLSPRPDLLLVDGNRFRSRDEIPYRCIVKGDATYACIAAASILAKTERDRLMKKVQELHVEENVEFLPAVKRDEVPELLSQFDALYVGLQRQPLFRFGVSPNKLMDYMMAGKPVIFAIDAGNDMVAEAGCGVSIPPEDSAAIAKAAEQLAASPKEELAAMGERGHRFILENYEYDVLAKKFIDVFESPYRAKK